MNTKTLALRTAALGIFAVSLLAQTAQPPEAPFGQIGVGASETARINVYCRADVPPGPCVVGFAFADGQGRILRQVTLTISPGRAGSLDIQGTTGRMPIVPLVRMSYGGAALVTLEVFDNQTGATRSLLGAVGITPPPQ